jgi:hypothetical protein
VSATSEAVIVTLSGVGGLTGVAAADNLVAEQVSVSLVFVVVLGVQLNPLAPDTVLGLGQV